MSLCTCEERPRCQYQHCREFADWSLFTPPGRWIKTWPHGRLHFMCILCRDYYLDACSKPLKGIDRPEGADEDWRGSILDHLRHARIAIAFDKRQEKEPEPDPDYLDHYWRDYMKRHGFTPAQCAQFNTLRALHRKYSLPQGKGSGQ